MFTPTHPHPRRATPFPAWTSRLSLLALCALTPLVQGQESVPPPEEDIIDLSGLPEDLGGGTGGVAPPEEDIIQLSPFVVDASRDVGYRATNTVSGTSLNTPIKELPMPIEVITAEWLADTAATSFEESLSYSSGVFTSQYTESSTTGRDGSNSPGANASYARDTSPSSRSGVGGRFSNAIIIRGFNVPFQNLSGFRYGGLIAEYGVNLGGIVDNLNVDRMEVVRGPNSLLYGTGVLSGIVNIIPKRPLSAPSHSLSLTTGSNDYFRASLDSSAPLFRDLWADGIISYRLGGAFEDRGDWTDFYNKNLKYTVGQLQFRSRRLNVLLEGQYADVRYEGIGPRNLYDNLNAAFNSGFRNEYNEQFNWTRDFGGYPESYRFSGPDTYHWRREKNFLADVEVIPVENLTISVGAFYTEAEEEEFNMNLSTLTNEERSLKIKALAEATRIPADLKAFYDKYFTAFPPDPADVVPNDPRGNITDWRTVRYWWSRDPLYTETTQFRARATYQFETPFFFGDTPARHTFLVGRHDIRDVADFTQGRERIDNQYDRLKLLDETDPLIFRNLSDYSPIRYQGETLARPGFQYFHTKLWFTGHYGVYQGKYWNDKLTFITGLRHDRYHSFDAEYDRGTPGIKLILNPDNQTNGFLANTPEYGPEGATASKDWTGMYALSYQVIPEVSVYGMMSEGITPNTGARDGNYGAIASEQTESKEIGIKLDLWNGKLSGTISYYTIERSNAVWDWENAPAPVRWVGGIVHPSEEGDTNRGFLPSDVTSGKVPLSYGVDASYFDLKDITVDPVTKKYANGVLDRLTEFSDSSVPQTLVYLDYTKLDLPTPSGKTWRYYIEKAFADREKGRKDFLKQGTANDIDPIVYRRIAGQYLGVNTSMETARGANVTYTDEATGYDLQLVYSPLPNWQILFNYAHTEREAISPFNLASVVDPESGIGFGTEYDIWVRTFGRAAFGLEEHDDNGDGVVDRVTKNGDPVQMGDVDSADMVGGLQGTSLYFGSEDDFSLWTKYIFNEGPLDRIELGLGVNYTGPAATAVPIGGEDLANNQFMTPETEDRYTLDALLKYSWEWWRASWSAQLNVYNLLDDTHGVSIVSYENDGSAVLRRTQNWYAPRSFRLGLTVRF